MPPMDQLVQIAGSLLILSAFGLAQRGTLHQRSPAYLLLNALGSAALADQAVLGRQWGFLLLEGVWAALSVTGLAAVLRTRRVRLSQPTRSPANHLTDETDRMAISVH
jgi:hypothetical protein